MDKTISGIDHLLLQQGRFKNYRIGFVTNDAALTSGNEPSRKALLKKGFNIIKLFSPEHGITSGGADGTFQSNITDTLTQLPVISLYGDHLMPTEEDMADIDLVLFDIPDVGCRFYTYLWTMSYIMEACTLYNKPLVILDRPNPVGGDLLKAEGPFLNKKCSSFIGRWNIPIRHSCTLGELALYFTETQNLEIDLTIIRVINWIRDKSVSENNYRFTPTSPAISDIETALCYPGTGLLEGISINEGRGTLTPFTVFGAPWVDNELLLERLSEMNFPGVQFSASRFTPWDSLYAGKACKGLSLTITNENVFRPVQTGLAIIRNLLTIYPDDCRERLYKTVANPSGERHLDKLIGIENSLDKLKIGRAHV